MKLNAKHTVAACFTGATVQAIVINFSPLLFYRFEKEFNVSLSKISLLIAISFITQLIMDFAASRLPSVFRGRAMVVMGQVLSAVGLLCTAILTKIMSPYPALIISTTIAAFGSGIVEVVGNPLIESCPVENKNRMLSFMHSFFCWGHVFTVAVSTLFFYVFGIENWRILACIWALVPTLNAVAFMFVPLYEVDAEPPTDKKKRSVFHSFTFVALFVLMVCGGAAEQAMSQWASSFAEMGLGVSKSVGDLLGPCAFAILMGIARVIYAKRSDKMNLPRFMIVCSALCIVSYLIAALAPLPIISLIGCALCGFAVGIMWPGTLCLATERIPDGGVKMFALLALAGDVGCTVGPTAVGWIADAAGNNLKLSFTVSTVFPAVMILFIVLLTVKRKKVKNQNLQ